MAINQERRNKMIPDINIDTEFEAIPYDGIIVFSKRNVVTENRGSVHFEPTKKRLISSSIRKVRKKVFEF